MSRKCPLSQTVLFLLQITTMELCIGKKDLPSEKLEMNIALSKHVQTSQVIGVGALAP